MKSFESPPPERPVRILADAATMAIVSLLSCLLLIYIAHGNTRRTYEKLIVDKVTAQAELVRSSMESFLRAGLPVRHFSAFAQLTKPMIDGDQLLSAIVVETMDGDAIFAAGDVSLRALPRAADAQAPSGGPELRSAPHLLQLVLPLRNRFENVGNLVLSMNRAKIAATIDQDLITHLIVGFLASLALGGLVYARGGAARTEKGWLALSFVVTFLAVFMLTMTSMLGVFTKGAQLKGRALTDSLGQRLDDVPNYGLQFNQFEGLEGILEDYRKLNPEIGAIAMVVNGKVAIHTDPTQIGKVWVAKADHFDFTSQLTKPGMSKTSAVIVEIPKSYIYKSIASSLKNYAALFIASALFAYVGLQLAQARQNARRRSAHKETGDHESTFAIDLVKPVFFMAVFVDHMCYSFLPQHIASFAFEDGVAGGANAWPFTAYYLAFACALIPAGYYSRYIGPRALIVSGLALVCAGLAAMVVANSIGLAVLARSAVGLGQGMLFIGVQCFVVTNTTLEHRTRANGVIVFGYQGGMISGMAIGSLLAGEMGAGGVFAMSASIAAAAALFAFWVLPKERVSARSDMGALAMPKVIWSELKVLLRDKYFLNTVTFIGLPLKATLTGVVLFSLPLLLSGWGFAREDVGQIIMLYSGSVLVFSALVGSATSDLRSCRMFLSVGGLTAATALFMLAFAGSGWVASLAYAGVVQISIVIAGAILLGAAHGMSNAPVVTYISEAPSAATIGGTATAASYRLIERVGHTLGPVIAGQLMIASAQSSMFLAWIGASLVVMVAMFRIIDAGLTQLHKNQEFA